MRRRKPQLSTRSGEVPTELLVGHVLDVWSTVDGSGYSMQRMNSARQNYRCARRLWEEGARLDARETHKLLPPSRPLDVAFHCEHGERERAEARLARVGVAIDDLPALRQRALAWIEECA